LLLRGLLEKIGYGGAQLIEVVAKATLGSPARKMSVF
jgi:hypothetical protein